MKNIFNKEKFNLYVLYISFIFFITINLVYFYLHFNSLINTSNYAFNELFINYQSGFIRRGLLGEIVFQLNYLFSFNPRHVLSIFFLIIYLSTFIIFFSLFKRFINSILVFIIIFFSPQLLLFQIYNPDLYFIKDAIIKFTILLHAFIFYYFVHYKKIISNYFFYLKLLIIPCLFLIILIHEYQVFSISVHFLISLGAIKNLNFKKKLFIIYSPLLISFLLVLFFFGNENQLSNLNLILQKFDVELNPHLGGGIYKYLGAFYKWHFFYFSYRDFLNLIAAFVLSVIIIYILFEYLIEKKILIIKSQYKKKYLFYFLPCILPFFLTTDHGRNLSLISVYLISFYSTLSFSKEYLKKLNKRIGKSVFNTFLIILFTFFYIFMWKLNQFAGFGLRGIPNDIFQSSLFAEFSKLIKFLYNYIDLNIINLPQIKL